MARKLYATAPDGSVVVTTTDNDYACMVIADGPKGWHRVSAHGTLANAKKKVAASASKGLLIVPVTDVAPAAVGQKVERVKRSLAPVVSAPAASDGRTTIRQGVEQVFASHGRGAIKCRDLCEQVQAIAQLNGRTPLATISAYLYLQAQKDDGHVLKVAGKPGMFKLNPRRKK